MDHGNIVSIDRADDPRLAHYANLRHGDTRRRGERFIVEGRLPVERLTRSRYAVESVIVERGHEHSISTLADEGTTVYSLPRESLAQLVGFDFHRGVLACGRRMPLQSIDHFYFPDHDLPVALAVIGVTELENLGSMFRSAAAFGIRHILIGPQTIDPFSRRVIRVSMANVLSLEMYELDQPVIQLPRLSERMDIRTIASTLNGDATPLDQLNWDNRGTVLIVGNESDGLDRQLQLAATDRVTIPMQLGTDSLNVSVAAAVFMHAITQRTRRTACT